MLKISNIKKEYSGHMAVDDVSFELGDKESLSLLGESGCGKSTLLMIIAGLIKADSGKVLKDGRALPDEPHRREISMVFQDSTLWNHMTIKENILFGSPFKDSSSRNIQLEKLAEAFGIEKLLSRYPGQISGGQARRVAIARALACEREILLMDEPFSNLDKEWKERTINAAKNLTFARSSVIIVTHSPEEAEFFSDRQLRMEEGRLIG